jgi:hypothetical protein
MSRIPAALDDRFVIGETEPAYLATWREADRSL